MSTLTLTFDRRVPFDVALMEASERGHHSKCFYGNKSKVVAHEQALDGDDSWANARVKFMPELREAHYTYAGKRLAQPLKRGDVQWLDRFDGGQPVRSHTVVLDPESKGTKVLYDRGATSSGSRTRPTRNDGGHAPGCNTNTTGNSGRAKRQRELVRQQMERATRAAA